MRLLELACLHAIIGLGVAALVIATGHGLSILLG